MELDGNNLSSKEENSLSSKRLTECSHSHTSENDVAPLEASFSTKGLRCEKRMKKDDSGINVVEESDSSEDESICDDVTKKERKCDKTVNKHQSELNSPDSGNLELSNLSVELDIQDKMASNLKNDNNTLIEKVEASGSDKINKPHAENAKEHKMKSDSDTDEEEAEYKIKKYDKQKYDPTPNTPKPIHKWNASQVVLNRQYGSSMNYSPDLFRYNCYGSLHMVERLELMYKMRKHDGCVNALHFNANGTKLVTGSDDLDIIIWDWTLSEPLIEYQSGHRSNVFQAKFMPLSGDSHVASCARDGQVRIGELSSAGSCKGTRKIAQHKGAAHKLAIQLDSPHTFLSCGEDAVVFELDLRKEKPEKLLSCKENEKKVPLYSIFSNPIKSYEYVVGGRDHFVRVYDNRFINQEQGYVKKYCPEHLAENDLKTNVTSVVYNYNGQEILASYNDEDIYTFDCKESDTSKFLHRYRGHRNSQTVKGVSYFGTKSEYIVSGSDCGYIFFWEKNSEHIVKYMYGDEGGVVNCLEPNPNMPVLATSGLDDDIKIWVPSCEELPNLSDLRDHISSNMKEREDDRRLDCPDAFDEQMIWFLMQHLRRARRRNQIGTDPPSSNSSSSDSDVQEEEAEFQNAIQCNQS